MNKIRSPSELLKRCARHLRDALGVHPKFYRMFQCKDAETFIDVFVSAGNPGVGLSTAATLGLSERGNYFKIEDRSLTVEILIVLPTCEERIAQIASECAFLISERNIAAQPGIVVLDVIRLCDPNRAMKHALLVTPLNHKVGEVDCGNISVTWLQMIPINEIEYEYARLRGVKHLKEKLEMNDIDLYDLDRESSVQRHDLNT